MPDEPIVGHQPLRGSGAGTEADTAFSPAQPHGPIGDLGAAVEHAFYDQGVGSNKRYADSLQRRRHNREAETRALIPRSLTEAERGSDTRRGPAIPVRAWVTVGDTSVQVLGTAVEWTSRAVHILWIGANDDDRAAWVWASAVERLDP